VSSVLAKYPTLRHVMTMFLVYGHVTMNARIVDGATLRCLHVELCDEITDKGVMLLRMQRVYAERGDLHVGGLPGDEAGESHVGGLSGDEAGESLFDYDDVSDAGETLLGEAVERAKVTFDESVVRRGHGVADYVGEVLSKGGLVENIYLRGADDGSDRISVAMYELNSMFCTREHAWDRVHVVLAFTAPAVLPGNRPGHRDLQTSLQVLGHNAVAVVLQEFVVRKCVTLRVADALRVEMSRVRVGAMYRKPPVCYRDMFNCVEFGTSLKKASDKCLGSVAMAFMGLVWLAGGADFVHRVMNDMGLLQFKALPSIAVDNSDIQGVKRVVATVGDVKITHGDLVLLQQMKSDGYVE